MFVGNKRRQGIPLYTRKWKKPNPTARQRLQVMMMAASQHFSTKTGFKRI